MTKKIVLSILLVYFVFVLKTYAVPPSIFYVANKDTCLYRNHGGDYIGNVQKGQKLLIVHDKNFGFADDYVEVETEDFDRGYISIDDIEIQGSLSTKECFKGNWIAKYCLDSLYKSDISIFFDYEGNIIDYFNEEYKDTDHGLEDNYSSWHELIGVGYAHFNNCCFYIGTVHGAFDALILNIDDKAMTFYSLYVDKRRTGRFYDRLERDTIYVMDYEIDGDYLNLYIDNQPFITYVNLDKRTELEIRNFLKEENYNIENITFPRHADGTCDYDSMDDITTAATSNIIGMEESADALATEYAEPVEEVVISNPAPAMGKTATVTENLRLRTDDKTAAEVVATLAADTRVKVHLPGKEDTIDGIRSNWVWVETLGGAKDKDGNAVEAGTKGWLFGGYLSEAEDMAETKENADARQNAALPILPIAAGIAALAILLAVILLAAKRRKSGR